MITLTKKNLLPVLKRSGLSRQFKGEISVPKQYVLNNLIINDQESFNRIMDTLRYYMIDNLPDEIYEYVNTHQDVDISFFKDFFFEELTLLKKYKLNEALDSIIEKGFLNLLKYWYKIRESKIGFHECIFTEWSCSIAAEYGHLKVLEFIHTHGGNLYPTTCEEAIKNNNVECLKYAINNGCKLSQTLCQIAAEYDSLECLKFLHDFGCK